MSTEIRDSNLVVLSVPRLDLFPYKQLLLGRVHVIEQKHVSQVVRALIVTCYV